MLLCYRVPPLDDPATAGQPRCSHSRSQLDLKEFIHTGSTPPLRAVPQAPCRCCASWRPARSRRSQWQQQRRCGHWRPTQRQPRRRQQQQGVRGVRPGPGTVLKSRGALSAAPMAAAAARRQPGRRRWGRWGLAGAGEGRAAASGAAQTLAAPLPAASAATASRSLPRAGSSRRRRRRRRRGTRRLPSSPPASAAGRSRRLLAWQAALSWCAASVGLYI